MSEGPPLPPQGEANQGTGSTSAEHPVRQFDLRAVADHLEQKGNVTDAANIRESIQKQQTSPQNDKVQEFSLKAVAAELRKQGQHQQADDQDFRPKFRYTSRLRRILLLN